MVVLYGRDYIPVSAKTGTGPRDVNLEVDEMKRKPLWAVALGVAVCLIVLGIVKQRRASYGKQSGQVHVQGDTRDLANTIVTTHLEQRIVPGKNVIWCSTFQLAWNKLCYFTGGPIKMRRAPAMVDILNQRKAAKKDLDKASYVAMVGLVENGIEEKIRQVLDRKFRGQAEPELLSSVPIEGWVMYAYLAKSLPFRWAFDRFQGGLRFGGQMVDSFGIEQFLGDEQRNEAKMATQVTVLDHRSNDDLVVELRVKAKGDQLILAKVPPEASLAETITMVEKRIADGKPTPMREMEDLFVPVLDFKVVRYYKELCGKQFKTANGRLDNEEMGAALQSIRFRLDERGAVLKSEGVGAGGMTKRNLVFDKPFLVLLKRREAENPYFAMWVGNADLMILPGGAKADEDLRLPGEKPE